MKSPKVKPVYATFSLLKVLLGHEPKLWVIKTFRWKVTYLFIHALIYLFIYSSFILIFSFNKISNRCLSGSRVSGAMQGMVRHSSAQGEKGGERLSANQHAYSSLTQEHHQGRLRVHRKVKWEELLQTAMEVTEEGNTWEPLRERFLAVLQYKMRQKGQTHRTKSQLCLVVIDAVFSAEKWR